ncbi:MAG: response regulator [Candidatus Saganbacteria bacterium]|nr:response regulator [Candidatus Saganbacteria bacterium]
MAKILMVDDEVNILKIAGTMLERSGHTVILAASGEEALEKAKADPPDLILLDRSMPGMGGTEVLSSLRDQKALNKIPVIFLTAQDSESEMIEGLRGGAVDYITKPFNMDDLRDRVEFVLKKYTPKPIL